MYIEICKAANVSERTLNSSFCCLPFSTRRNRLNGWLLLQQFCAKYQIDVATLESYKNPALLFVDMIVEIRESAIKDHLCETVRPALQQILDIIGRNIKIVDNSFATSLFRITSTTVKKGSKHVTIWKLEPFLSHNRTDPY
jgi:hypothetical protein